MNKINYLPKKETKQLKEWGCTLQGKYSFENDICDKYHEEFLGGHSAVAIPMIMTSLREGDNDKAVDYFMDITIFNPENKVCQNKYLNRAKKHFKQNNK